MRRINTVRTEEILLSGVLAKKTVPELLSALFEETRLPSICFDTSFALIGYTFPRPFYFQHWEDIAANGTASSSDISEYHYLDSQQEMIRHGSAMLFNDGTCLGYPQACRPVFLDQRVIAYCGIMIEDASLDDVLAAVDQLASAISAVLRRNIARGNDISRRDAVFLRDDTLQADEISILRKLHKGSYLFASIHYRDEELSKISYYRQKLSIHQTRYQCFAPEKHLLYILISDIPSQDAADALISQWETLFTKDELLVGFSAMFDDPAEIPIHRRQAFLALLYSRKEFGVSRFLNEYSRILYKADLELFGIEFCIPPEIRLLETCDNSEGTDYLHTLTVWSDCFHRKSLISEKLNQHFSTVANRLSRIEDITGKNPMDYPELYETGISVYRILKEEE